MTNNNAQVKIRSEFTVLTPGGGAMRASYGSLFPITKGESANQVIFQHEGQAVLEVEKLNQALRDNGIDDRNYSVASRTITTVTSEWSVVPND